MPENKLIPFLQLTLEEKREIINQTAAKMQISPILIEKDFWVSFLLNEIFSDDISNHMTFKGGTSLSKCYNLIKRFSEDIDLTIQKEALSTESHTEEMSGKALQKYLKELQNKGREFVATKFIPKLEEILHKCSGLEKWSIEIDQDEPMNIRFFYPISQEIDSNSYVKPSVLIEFGVKGKTTPSEKHSVQSYVQNHFPNLITEKNSQINVLSPIRTFWEKATILHAEYHRPKDKTFGDRLSRHYYDIYEMIQAGIGKKALENLDLLADVSAHKKRFFRVGWANYEEAIPATIHLTPHKKLEDLLLKDYKQMQGMIFGKVPTFEIILKTINEFEDKLKPLPKKKSDEKFKKS